MKRIYTLFLMLAFSLGIMAKPVDVETAKQLGGKFMMINHRSTSSLILAYTEKSASGMEVCYVFNCQPKGFVIVAADDRMKPILGYSNESNFTSVMPDGLRALFDNYKAGFEQMVANDDPQVEQAVADWNSVAETGLLSGLKRDRVVEPLLSSLWNQTDLYNNMAPEDPSSVFSGHCKAGCVANAMSQIMRYWEWPRHGVGEHSYEASSYYGYYGEQYANFGSATYRFELMPDYLDFASPQHEVDAVALLERHAGVSVDMGYGPTASGAYSEDVGPAMESYFRYSTDLYHTYMDDEYEWTLNLIDNLDAGMPLYYASSGDNGGHAYVVDGYDEFELFHLNWGWAGFDNGYFAIDGFYLTYYSFPWWHNAIFNLHPDAEYYQAPMAVDYLEVSELGENRVKLEFNPNYMNRGGEPLSYIDTIVIMRDGYRIASLPHVTDDQVYFEDQVEKNGTYYYAVYAVNGAGMSKVSRDTVMVGSTCDIRFELFDDGFNGWDMSSIAVLDEDGKVSRRVTLWDGGEASLVLPVPSNQTATFFWTYDNTCYTHGLLSEASYEIYDWDDNLIVASNGYPEIGEIVDYEIDCGHVGIPEAQESIDVEFTQVEVFNVMGQRVYSGKVSSMNPDAWKSGAYLLRYSSANGETLTRKLVK